MTLQPGDRVGHYEVVGLLGEGGMGTVYRARDPRLDRVVALKVLRADLAVDPDRQARFVQEAKAVSALNHPNIVTVHDIGTHGEIAYMVMELVDGEPLDQGIPQRGMRLSDVLRISVQIADAFSEAHRAQIVHRDLKPANVMVLPNGRVKVLDFGLAKLLEPAAAAAGHSMVTQTSEGTIVGTAAYMSPEQQAARCAVGHFFVRRGTLRVVQRPTRVPGRSARLSPGRDPPRRSASAHDDPSRWRRQAEWPLVAAAGAMAAAIAIAAYVAEARGFAL